MSYFTVDEFRAAMSGMDDPTYTDTMITASLAWFTALVERVCGTSFEARSTTDTLSAQPISELVLSQTWVQSITSVTLNGALLSGFTYTFKGGVLRRYATNAIYPYPWYPGVDNVVVVYQAGYTATCPLDLKDAAMVACRDRILKVYLDTGISLRAISASADANGANVNYSLAGTGRPTGIPTVDETIMGYADLTHVGFA